MIANSTELGVAVRQLRIMSTALKALRTQLDTANPNLLAVTEKSYLQRIESLQHDISHYLCDHPTDVSLLLGGVEDREHSTAKHGPEIEI
jgi:hypothetical protein